MNLNQQNHSHSSSENISEDGTGEDCIKSPRPVVLLLLDGFGVAQANEGNAFSNLKLPTLSKLINNYPVALLSPLEGSVNQRYLSLGTGDFKNEEDLSSQKKFLSLSSFLAEKNIRQIKITGSERFASLTNFFNGLEEDSFPFEDLHIISSSLKNGKQLSRENISKKIFAELLNKLDEENLADLIIVSEPAIDLSARHGNIELTKKEIIQIDKLLKKLVDKILEKNAVLLISSTFGNAEKMMDLGMEIEDNLPTQNPLPLIFVNPGFKGLRAGESDVLGGDLSSLNIYGSLIDIVPTILELLGFDKPEEFKGKALTKNLL